MLKSKLNITAFFAVVLLIISVTNITAFAEELPELSDKGILIVSMKKDGRPVPGGEFEIYQIAGISLPAGKINYEITKDFKNCNIPIDNIESDEVIYNLESYITNNGISGMKTNVDDNGIAEFSSLKPGIYFVKQNNAAEGYRKVSSFTVSLPFYERGKYQYTVTANPKLVSNRFDNNNPPTTVKSPNSNGDHNQNHNGGSNQNSNSNSKHNGSDSDSRLPKTGQLNLPVPILTVTGFCMIVFGFIIRCCGRKDYDKK